MKIVASDLESMDTIVPLGFFFFGFTLVTTLVVLSGLTHNPFWSMDLSIWAIIRSTSSLFSTGKTLVKRVRINSPVHVDLKAWRSSLANDKEGDPLGPDFKLALQPIEKGLIGFNLKVSLKYLAAFDIS
jgi:hypothetical protein